MQHQVCVSQVGLLSHFHWLLVFTILATVYSNPAGHVSKRSLANELTRQISKTELSTPPELRVTKSPPSTVTVREGESLSLECSAMGVPGPVIHWRKDGDRLIQSDKEEADPNLFEKLTNVGSKTVQSSSTLGRLHLDCVQPSMAGMYECVSDNGFHRAVKHTKVVVLPRKIARVSHWFLPVASSACGKPGTGDSDQSAVPPQITLFTEWRFETAGNNVQLYCRATGVPKPEITWLDEDQQEIETGGDVTVLSNGDLFIRNVNHMGQYYCVASNEAGEARLDAFLYVTKE